jgi:hypothetical protein
MNQHAQAHPRQGPKWPHVRAMYAFRNKAAALEWYDAKRAEREAARATPKTNENVGAALAWYDAENLGRTEFGEPVPEIIFLDDE